MFAYCPVCKLDMAVRKITVRGLCPDSMFNTVYTLTIMGAGAPRYLGHYTSSIQFDRDQRLWLWLDMKEGESKATRTEYGYLMILMLIFCAENDIHDISNPHPASHWRPPCCWGCTCLTSPRWWRTPAPPLSPPSWLGSR